MIATIQNRKTLTDLLITAAENSPKNGIGYVKPDESIAFISYPELLEKAQTHSAALIANGLVPGDKVMIIMSRNEDIIAMLWACFFAGLVPTILQPPLSFSEFNQPARKIENVFRILQNPKVIISPDLMAGIMPKLIPSDHLIHSNNIVVSDHSRYIFQPAETDTAFIQFSSGSTGDPKGIIISHKNVLSNLAAISIGIDLGDDDVSTNWMPLYHDMGLFGYHLCAVFAHCNQFIIDPVDFVKKPSLWLDVMDKVRCTITGSPNFGQALVLRYLKGRDEKVKDLSSIKVLLNGAEPISSRIMTEFMDRLSVFNFHREAMMPAYGMAEATLAVSFSELKKIPLINSFNRTRLLKDGKAIPETENPTEIIELVSVGKALNNVEIRIVNELGEILEDGNEGHIQIKGLSVTSGYFNNPVETSESFDHDWLKTGDKGFIFQDQLYITGRVKDIIFVHGQNLYAHDLENLASKHSDIPYGKVIVGGVFDLNKGKDQIILFLVGSPNQAACDMFLEMRNFFRDAYGIAIDVFVPVRSNQVPKTSSGKIQRYKLIADYQAGVFDEAIAEIRRRTVGR
jgi:acyl-CoA synthetase (AMP-forming)/AMP-acid ligase II